jgi:hypothetical protein
LCFLFDIGAVSHLVYAYFLCHAWLCVDVSISPTVLLEAGACFVAPVADDGDAACTGERGLFRQAHDAAPPPVCAKQMLVMH